MRIFGPWDKCECGRLADRGLAKPIPAQANLTALTESAAVQGLLNRLLDQKAIRADSEADRRAEALLRRERYLAPAFEGSTRLIRPTPLCRTCYLKETRALESALDRAATKRERDARAALAEARAVRKAERAAKAADFAAKAAAEAKREAKRLADEAEAARQAAARARELGSRAEEFGLPDSIWRTIGTKPGHPWTASVERILSEGPSPLRAACRLLDLNWDGVFGFPWVPDADATLRGELPADVGLPDHFECRECGRWADVVEAAAAKTDAMATINSEWRPLFTDWKQSIGPALLQRWRGVTYQEATRVLAASERRGLIRPQGRGYVAVPALCAPCYRNRADRLASAPTAPPRDAVPAHIRFRVLQRDNFRCQYCGVSARDGALLHVDHVVPYSEGGETSEDNLITACEQCNLGKSARPIIQE